MATTRDVAARTWDQLKDTAQRILNSKADLESVSSMSKTDVKRNKKWLTEQCASYEKLYKALLNTPYKNDPELEEINKSTVEAANALRTMLAQFAEEEKADDERPTDENAGHYQVCGASSLMQPHEVSARIESIEGKRGPNQEECGTSSVIQHQKVNCRIESIEGKRTPNKVVLGKDDKMIRRFQLRRMEFEEKVRQIRGKLSDASERILEMNRANIESQYKEISSIYEKICDACMDDDEMEENYSNIRESFGEILEEIALKLDENQQANRISSTKLEDIKIPFFNGKIDTWTSFYEIFKKLVDENKKLSKVEKFYRLKSVVKGDASRIIQHLHVTAENYDAAWAILEQRYNNRRLLFCTLLDRIIDHPNISIQKSDSIKKLLDATTESCQALKAMGIRMDDADPFIARILIRKLDSEGLLRYEQCVQKTKDIQALDDVMSFLEQQYLAQEAVSAKKASGTIQKTQKSSSSYQASARTCQFCSQQGHAIHECRKFENQPATERYSWVQKAKVCKICMSHRADKKCFRFNNKCEHCGGRHHPLLHVKEAVKTTSQPQGNKSTSMVTKQRASVTLLATAQIHVDSIDGERILLRALIDQGSQRTSVSEEAAQILRLPRKKSKTYLNGLGDTLVGISKSTVELTIRPRFQSKSLHKVEAMVLTKLTSPQPDRSFTEDMKKWDNYCLADPRFNKSDRIDLVIGVDVLTDILQPGFRKWGKVIGQETTLGWILSGTLNAKYIPKSVISAVTADIERFWEMEEVDTEPEVKEDDRKCEEKFKATTQLNKDNRFVVKLPFKEDRELGDSRQMAMARLLHLEKKLKANPALKEEYVKFMDTYINMGHMERISDQTVAKYIMPHQAVIRNDHSTTKVRVVFDASAKSSNGRSLNDVLHIGPKLQHDIFEILVKWRLWRFVITSDVEKMYRQICVAEEDQVYQTVLWRRNFNKPIEQFKLKTVTYGTSSAPFLAKRVLMEIASDCQKQDPKLNQIITEDFYMDDLMTGADSIEECIRIRNAVDMQLLKFGFKLRKWLANEPGILKDVRDAGEHDIVKIQEDESVKTLGVQWRPYADSFAFYFNLKDDTELTKRKALSTLAKIYDPLGWLAPVTVMAKLFIQKLWLMDVQWDTKLSADLMKEWGWLPKLELCAAHLLSKLIRSISEVIQREVRIYAWSDSMIALAWIKNAENVKDKFIRVRVKDINNNLPTATWMHVRSKDNPADAASRGLKPEKLAVHALRWKGPSWLCDNTKWPTTEASSSCTVLLSTKSLQNIIHDLTERISSFSKLLRVVAYIIRFGKRLKGEICPSWITSNEIKAAKRIVILQSQRHGFPDEIQLMQSKKELPTSHKLASLYPFLDDDGVLRVGGRLENSSLSYDRKHPVLLPKCHLTTLLIDHIHKTTLHGGIRVMENMLRREYWIVRAKDLLKKAVRQCVKCARYRREAASQLMGNLPENRVSISSPFNHTGVDYAGPIPMRVSKGRGQKSYKGYIAIFVCMATKAVHLEAVSDLSSETFMAALRRFFARRGKSSHIYSDNGANFVGASRIIDEEYQKAILSNSSLAGILSAEQITWHFLPPRAPHFGGIWEAAVKSVKHHLRRVIGEVKLIFEEMTTLLTQIEAVLNSRPLYDLGSDAENTDVLTPGHFLIGKPLLDVPEEVSEDLRVDSLNRWKVIQKMRFNFWNKWEDDYLSSLQHRRKWKHSTPNIAEDQLVLVKDEDTSPARWPLGRILQTHEGADGKVRVVSVKMQNGTFKRPITKICVLEGVNVSDPKSEVNVPDPKSEENVPVKNKPKKLDISMTTVLFTMMAIVFGQAAAAKNDTKTVVASIGPSVAVYLDNLGSVDLTSSKWNMILYYNLDTYLASLSLAENLTEQSWPICSRMGELQSQCESTLRRIERRVSEIKNNNRMFSLSRSNRSQRGVNVIGSLYNFFFGLMDDDDRRELEENMRALLENQHSIDDLLHKQSTVVDATMNLLQKTIGEVNANYKEIQERVNNITELMQERFFIYKESLKFMAITKDIEAQLTEIETTQFQIIRLLVDINHGKISPDLLKPEQLTIELAKIKEGLAETLKIPGGKGSQVATVLRLLTGKAVIVDNKLVIKTEIPLISTRFSNIFKVIPVPVVHGLNHVVASIPRPYLLYSHEGDVYHLMTELEFHQCKEGGDRNYICESQWAWQDADDNTCEVAPLKPHKGVYCQFIESTSRHMWVNLNNRRQWLFKTAVNSTLHVFCDHKRQDLIQLPLQGVLTLSSGCSGQIGRTSLPSSNSIESSVQGVFGSYLINEIKYKNESIKPLEAHVIEHIAEIKDIRKHLHQLQETDLKLKGLHFRHATGHAALILVSIVIVIVIIYFVRKCMLKRRADAIIMFRRPQNV